AECLPLRWRADRLSGLSLPLRTAEYDRRNWRRYRRGGWGGKCHFELWGALPAAAIYGSGDRVLPNRCKLGTAICCANSREGSGHESIGYRMGFRRRVAQI